MHAHIKATESIILILNLSTGSRTLLPRPQNKQARDSSGCRHSEHTTHPPAQPPLPHHQIHVQDSQQQTHGRAAAQERKDQHGAAPSPSQSSSPAVESPVSVS
ncbi:hypothetical protein TcCL_NonESM08243 [Trypanosoma cruzi]|nr:hypothetical protein TcCL_NonESM08243 [Trypanosoma cruzi]